MRPVAQGRPDTEVIPTGWEEAHRPVVDKTRTAACELRMPGTTQVWSPEQDQMVDVPLMPYWTGLARVQDLTDNVGANSIVAEDDPMTLRFLVVVGAEVTAREGDVVRVTDAGDPMMNPLTLTVSRVVIGTERFERDLYCTVST